MDQPSYLMNLNRFFAAMAGAIIDSGGEILSYIGDAVLAIFPIAEAEGSADGVAAACGAAIRAARLAGERIAAANAARPDLPTLQYGVGLHVGDVTYGNIGIPERLQFTVIGSAANEASRIEGMTKELGVPVVVSSRFAASYRGSLVFMGSHALKGVSGMHDLFALA
jgi:adenylate cyclase